MRRQTLDDILVERHIGAANDPLQIAFQQHGTAAPVEVSHRSAAICHLGGILALLDRPLKWDPDAERFIDDPEADRLLSRSMRAPWHV